MVTDAQTEEEQTFSRTREMKPSLIMMPRWCCRGIAVSTAMQGAAF